MKIEPKHICSNCGTEIPEGAEICPGCKGRVVRRNNSPDGKAEESGGRDIPELKEDTYVWAQAVLPAAFALFYYFAVGKAAESEGLWKTIILFSGFTALFGLIDTAELNRRLIKRGMRLSDGLRIELALFPIAGMWKRRLLPGMKRDSMYPHVHSLLVLLLVFVLSLGGGLAGLLYV